MRTPHIKSLILQTVLTGGFLTMAVVAPNCLQLLKYVGNDKSKRNRSYYIKSTISKMIDQGLIKFQKGNSGKKYLKVTPKGLEELEKYELKEKVIKKPFRWDRKWRIVIFDVKETRRSDRDKLRRQLVNLGFYKLQNSVWVHPYKCQEILTLFKARFHLGWSVIYAEAEEIENEKKLLAHFNLGNH